MVGCKIGMVKNVVAGKEITEFEKEKNIVLGVRFIQRNCRLKKYFGNFILVFRTVQLVCV